MVRAAATAEAQANNGTHPADSPRRTGRKKSRRTGSSFIRCADGPQPYWNESACYRFTAAEIDTLEAAANQLQVLCLDAAQHIIDHKRYAELDIPPEAIPAIEWAWENEPPALYGRFDISWGGAHRGHPPKLLEYNADTPTSLLEAAVIQWHWLKEIAPDPSAVCASRPVQLASMRS